MAGHMITDNGVCNANPVVKLHCWHSHALLWTVSEHQCCWRGITRKDKEITQWYHGSKHGDKFESLDSWWRRQVRKYQ